MQDMWTRVHGRCENEILCRICGHGYMEDVKMKYYAGYVDTGTWKMCKCLKATNKFAMDFKVSNCCVAEACKNR